MQDNNKTLIKTVKTPLKLSETHSKTWTRPYFQENLQMSILQQQVNNTRTCTIGTRDPRTKPVGPGPRKF